VEFYDELGGRPPTNRELLEIIAWSEYATSMVNRWPNEAVARRYFNQPEGCGTDGCVGDEVYEFLEYYSAALNQNLDDEYDEFVDSPGSHDRLAANMAFILDPANASWRNGVLANTPFGFANTGLAETNNCPAAGVEVNSLCARLRYCNSERFAVSFTRVVSGQPNTYYIFFGTTITTDGKTISVPASVGGGTVACALQ
jgi:hypothetical protein